MNNRLRLGIVGTGYWADVAHARAAAASSCWDLSAVYGRDAEKAVSLATRHGAGHAGDDFDAFLQHVDAVTFAVPPNVQAVLALRAIEAGKHVALEKPIALNSVDAERLVAAAERNKVAGVVLFTMLYDPRVRALTRSDNRTWHAGHGVWLGSALADNNPFNTPWRHDKGGLWDVGPHAVAVLCKALGPIVGVNATRGAGDLVHAIFTHAGGATSTATMTLQAPDAADGFATMLWGPHGRDEVTVDDVDAVASFTTAYDELAGLIHTGQRSHECDLKFGSVVVDWLAATETQLLGARA